MIRAHVCASPPQQFNSHFPLAHNSIIVEGPAPWAEDGWHRIAIGGMSLRVVKPCSRCKVPNIDQETSEGGMTVTNALKTFRYYSVFHYVFD